jgi:hypothetical protein
MRGGGREAERSRHPARVADSFPSASIGTTWSSSLCTINVGNVEPPSDPAWSYGRLYLAASTTLSAACSIRCATARGCETYTA